MASSSASAPGGGGRHALSAASHAASGRRLRTSFNGSQAGIEHTSASAPSSSAGTSLLSTSPFTSSTKSSYSLNSTYSRILSQALPNISSTKRTAKKIRSSGAGRRRFDHPLLNLEGVDGRGKEHDNAKSGKRKVGDEDRTDEHRSQNEVEIMPQWIQDILTTSRCKRPRPNEWERFTSSARSSLVALGAQDDMKRPERLALPYHRSSHGDIGRERVRIGENAREKDAGGIAEGTTGFTKMAPSPLTLPIPFSTSNDVRTSSIFPPPPYTQPQPRPALFQPRPYLLPPSPFIQPLRPRPQTPHLNTYPSIPFSTPGRPKSRASTPLKSLYGVDPCTRPRPINVSSHHQFPTIAQNVMKQLETIDEEEDGMARASSELSYMSLGERGMMGMSLRTGSGSCEGREEQWHHQEPQMRGDGTSSPILVGEHLPSSAENFWTSQHRRQEDQTTYYPTSTRSLNIELLESAAQAQAQMVNSQDTERSCSSMSLSTQGSGRGRMAVDGIRMVVSLVIGWWEEKSLTCDGAQQQLEINGEQQDTQSQRTRSSQRKSFRAPMQTFCPTPSRVPGVPDLGPRPRPNDLDMDVDSICSFDEKAEAMTHGAQQCAIDHGNISNASASEAVSMSISEGGSLSEDRTRVASSDHDTKMEDPQGEKKEFVVNHEVGFVIWQDG